MKLMFCQDCGSLVVPDRDDGVARSCHCGRHSVWWRNGAAGLISFHDLYATELTAARPYPSKPRAWMIGIDNGLLLHHAEQLTAEDYRFLAEACPSSYLFNTMGSAIIRVRPGETNDSRWEAKLP